MGDRRRVKVEARVGAADGEEDVLDAVAFDDAVDDNLPAGSGGIQLQGVLRTGGIEGEFGALVAGVDRLGERFAGDAGGGDECGEKGGAEHCGAAERRAE